MDFIFHDVTIALTDMTGNYVFKHGFERIRPCGDPDFFFHVRLLVDHCSSGYSFVSNHAANHFGLAAFFFITMRTGVKEMGGYSFHMGSDYGLFTDICRHTLSFRYSWRSLAGPAFRHIDRHLIQ